MSLEYNIFFDFSDIIKLKNRVSELYKRYPNFIYTFVDSIANNLVNRVKLKFVDAGDRTPTAYVINSKVGGKRRKPKIIVNFPKRYIVPFLGVRSGKLRSSVMYKGRKSRKTNDNHVVTAVVSVGDGLKYGELMEEGGVIEPKRAKYLTIPVNKEAVGKSPKKFSDTFIMSSFICKRVGRKIIPLYYLSSRVNIGGSFFVENSVDEVDNNLRSSKYMKELLDRIEFVLINKEKLK